MNAQPKVIKITEERTKTFNCWITEARFLKILQSWNETSKIFDDLPADEEILITETDITEEDLDCEEEGEEQTEERYIYFEIIRRKKEQK